MSMFEGMRKAKFGKEMREAKAKGAEEAKAAERSSGTTSPSYDDAYFEKLGAVMTCAVERAFDKRFGPAEPPKVEPKHERKPEPKPEPKAEPKVEPKTEPVKKPEPKSTPKVEPKPEPKPEPPKRSEPRLESSSGVKPVLGKAYKYWVSSGGGEGYWEITSDVFTADQMSPNAWFSVWVWYSDDKILRPLTSAEIEEFCPVYKM